MEADPTAYIQVVYAISGFAQLKTYAIYHSVSQYKKKFNTNMK